MHRRGARTTTCRSCPLLQRLRSAMSDANLADAFDSFISSNAFVVLAALSLVLITIYMRRPAPLPGSIKQSGSVSLSGAQVFGEDGAAARLRDLAHILEHREVSVSTNSQNARHLTCQSYRHLCVRRCCSCVVVMPDSRPCGHHRLTATSTCTSAAQSTRPSCASTCSVRWSQTDSHAPPRRR